MKKEKWVWMPHAGHLIVCSDCRFHLNTYVGKYIVSTVGEWLPDSASWDIYAKSKGVTLEGKGDDRRANFLKKVGFLEIGMGRTYETMVFKARKSKHKCCPYEQRSGTEVDFEGYNDADEAFKGHMRLCSKWSR